MSVVPTWACPHPPGPHYILIKKQEPAATSSVLSLSPHRWGLRGCFEVPSFSVTEEFLIFITVWLFLGVAISVLLHGSRAAPGRSLALQQVSEAMCVVKDRHGGRTSPVHLEAQVRTARALSGRGHCHHL